MRRIKALAVLTALLCCMLTVGAFAAVTCIAGEQPSVTVSVRIEGITENLYCGDITVGQGSTIQDVLMKLDESEADITVTGLESGYITAVNSDGSGLTETGWDGWLLRVNNVSLSVGIADATVEDGDEIVLYYSDEFVSGMQYPEMDVSDIENGVLKFTSKDTVYDENYNASVVTNPVVGMTVIWYDGETSTAYTTNESGTVTIDADKLTAGDHRIEIERAENGLPTVLRFAPNTVVTIVGTGVPDGPSEHPTEAPTTVGTGVPDGPSESPENNGENGGCSSAVGFAIIPMTFTLALAGATVCKKRRK